MGKKLTHEDFMQRVIGNNERVRSGQVEIVGKYKGAVKPILCTCNVHHCTWDAYPRNLYNGSGCAKCGYEQQSLIKKSSHDDFLNKLNDKNEQYRNNTLMIVGIFNGIKNPIECYCNIHDYSWSPLAGDLYTGHGCPRCGTDESFKKRIIPYDKCIVKIHKHFPSISIIGEYINATTDTQFQCEKGHVWTAKPKTVYNGHGCPYCSHRAVLIGYNDLWTLRPDIARLLKNSDDGYKYMPGSNQKADFVCPDCGFAKLCTIRTVSKDGFSCDACSDGISYPNKFGRSMLRQLPVESLQCEYQPDWAKPYRYDNYFKYHGVEYILEMDGAFHYVEANNARQTLEDRKKIDIIKAKLASEHGVEIIRINCFNSDKTYITNSILKSKLYNIFDLSAVNWEECDKNSQSSLVKETCQLYMRGEHRLTRIASLLNLSICTVRNYLKRGAKLGWCNYNVQNYLSFRKKHVQILSANGDVIMQFSDADDCAKYIHDYYNIDLRTDGIQMSCRQYKPYKGFNFRYVDNTIQN